MHIEANGEEVRYGLGWWLQVTLDRAKVTEADRWCSGSVVYNVWVCVLVLLEG